MCGSCYGHDPTSKPKRMLSVLMRRLAVVLPLYLALSCGAESPPQFDAASVELDASPPDAAVDPCMALCTCAADFCGGELTACLATCASLDDSVVQCRLLHCGYAQTNPSFHCPHVDGVPDAPGVPAECIQE